MSSLGLPFEFTLPALWQSHYDTWKYTFDQVNAGNIQAYQAAVDQWVLNFDEHGSAAAGAVPPVPLKLTIWKTDGEPGTSLGPDPVCGVDPRITQRLNPPTPETPTSYTPKVGPPYGDDPTKFFAFGDTCPVGYDFPDPIRGTLVKCMDHGQFMPIYYWKKKAA